MSNRSSGLFDAAKFQFRPPYLLFLGEEDIAQRAKTATGLHYWRPEFCLGQHRVAGEQTWKSLGLPLPEMSPEEAVAQGAHSLIICMNDAIEARWVPTLAKAATLGLDIVSGTYDILGEIPEIRAAAEKSGAQLIDLRVPRVKFPETALKWAEQNKQNFGKHRPGKRCLAIGTDICVGKMFSMLAMEREMHRRGLKATFRATGQIGVLISSSGIAHDAIAGDFMVGTVEALTPANDPDHWDLVEGQGSLFHPYFSPSTISLMYGAQPDALVICHDLGREKNTLLGWPTQPLAKLRDMTLELCRLANPEVRLVGISLNTSSLATDADAMRHMAQVEAQIGVPCIDPIRGSVGPLVDEMLK